MPPAPTTKPAPRIQIQAVQPQVDCGRYPVKCTEGDRVDVSANVFKDGHDVLRVVVRYRRAGARRWQERPLEPVGNDRWEGSFDATELGRWQFTIEAWVDRYATMLDELDRKLAAGQSELAGELAEAELLFGPGDLDAWHDAASRLGDSDRHGKTSPARPLEVDVERERARFGAWYELFPRSWGGFEGVERVLPELAELGFDVVYLPPIHPIGTTNRKGRNNARGAEKATPAAPGRSAAPEGGHDADPPGARDAGRLRPARRGGAGARPGDRARLRDPVLARPSLAGRAPGVVQPPAGRDAQVRREPAQALPGHLQRQLRLARTGAASGQALRDVVLHWCRHGVRAFRVDNPHTKSVPFWEWLIGEVRTEFPDTVFFAEAFTRPAMMTTLAKSGFSQSYTYFTWKNTKPELREFLSMLLEWAPYYRPNFFANTPDILHEYLQDGGPPAFATRLVLAATLSPSYGIYSGYEQFERRSRQRRRARSTSTPRIRGRTARRSTGRCCRSSGVNEIRRSEPALQRFENLRLLDTHGEHVFAYAKGTEVAVAVNLDPHAPREDVVVVPPDLGVPEQFPVLDLLTGARYRWRIGRNYVGLAPGQAHVLKVGV